MKKNPLTVWTFSYKKSYYLTHPWKWFKDLYWNIRNFWHRGRYGYAYVDVWNFCDWYPRVAAEALRYLAKHGSGYPGVKPWETPEEWSNYLNYLANRLQRCADAQDILFGEERNEYKEEYDKTFTRAFIEEKDENGLIHAHYDFTPEDKELHKKYWEREKELDKADHEYDKETWRWLAEDLGHFWD